VSSKAIIAILSKTRPIARTVLLPVRFVAISGAKTVFYIGYENLAARWPSRLVATAEEDRLNISAHGSHVVAALSGCRTIAIYEHTP
jgi:hypothetical protein